MQGARRLAPPTHAGPPLPALLRGYVCDLRCERDLPLYLLLSLSTSVSVSLFTCLGTARHSFHARLTVVCEWRREEIRPILADVHGGRRSRKRLGEKILHIYSTCWRVATRDKKRGNWMIKLLDSLSTSSSSEALRRVEGAAEERRGNVSIDTAAGHVCCGILRAPNISIRK